MTSGTCALHGRSAVSPCRRCGTFRCDWCEKLTPDWGEGHCGDCWRFVAPKGSWLKRMPFAAMFLVAVLLFVATGALSGLVRQLARSA
ncbi:MAG: hypothetical protein IT380_03585 [Myxococcales bacterium]|nr:hypothetical protein [Myxococcales bacterium]